MSEKELDFFVDAIKLGLEDAGVRAREIARAAYMNMFNLYPEKAEKIKALLPKAYQLKLTRSEEEGLSELPSSPGSNSATLGSSIGSAALFKVQLDLSSTLDSLAMSTSSAEIASAPATFSKSEASSSQKSTSSAPAKASAPHPTTHRSVTQTHQTPQTPSALVSSGLQNADVIPVPSKKKIVPPKVQPSSSEALSTKFEKMASLNSMNLLAKSVSTDSKDAWGRSENRGSLDSQLTTSTCAGPSAVEQPAPVESSVEQAVLTLQARVRGTLSRRRSIVSNPFAALASSPQPASQPTNTTNGSGLTSTGNSGLSFNSGTTSQSTKSSASSATSAVTFASNTKGHSIATSSSLRTPISKRPTTGVRGTQETQPTFCTRTASVPTPAPASVRKTSTGSQDNARSISTTRSPRAASTSAAVPAVTPGRSKSASKTRPGMLAVGTPDKPASIWKVPAE